MKARIVQPDKSDIVLSIGMIVKNEEEMFPGCLEALKPLLEAVPSELVIVDTGSTDKTVEIAESYCAKVEYFEWINDYAAARNYGLKKCVGEWFMFVDADEHFTDVTELIEFFSNASKLKNYNSAFVNVRCFADKENKRFSDVSLARIARMTPELCFIAIPL